MQSTHLQAATIICSDGVHPFIHIITDSVELLQFRLKSSLGIIHARQSQIVIQRSASKFAD